MIAAALGVGLALGPRHGVGGVAQASASNTPSLAGAGDELRRLEPGSTSRRRSMRGERGRRSGRRDGAGRSRRPDGAGAASISSTAPESEVSASVDGQDLDRAAEAVVAPAAPRSGPRRAASAISSLRRAVVDGLEVRRHPGLEREALQQRLAEARGWSWIFRPPRQLEHAGEQAAGARAGRWAIGGSPISSASSAASAVSSRAIAQAASCALDARRSSRRRRPW